MLFPFVYEENKFKIKCSLFQKDSPPSVVVIDEVGKMELFSQAFVQTVKKLFSNPQTVILATIPISKGKPIPLVEEIRTRPDAKLFIVSILSTHAQESNIMYVQ